MFRQLFQVGGRQLGSIGLRRCLALRIALISGLLVAGGLAGEYSARRALQVQRDRILEEASVAAAALEPAECAALTGLASEELLPAYTALRNRLQRVHQELQHSRWAYLMAVNSGEIVFTVDSVPAGNPDHATCGDPYADAPDELHMLFRDGQSRVVGPYQDRWGTFVSAFVPVADPQSQQPVAVLGVDIDASRWEQIRRAGRRLPLIITLAATLLLIGLFVMIDRAREATARIARSETNLRLLMESAAEAILLLDADGLRFREANRACGTLFGMSREEILAAGPLELSPPLQSDGRPSTVVARERMETALQAGHASFPWVHRHRDGSLIYCDVRLTRLLAPGQRLLRATVLDTTQQVRLEREVRELQQALHRARLHTTLTRVVHGIVSELRDAVTRAVTSTQTLRATFDDLDRTLDLQKNTIDAVRENRATPELIDEAERSLRWATPIRNDVPRLLRALRQELRTMDGLASDLAPVLPGPPVTARAGGAACISAEVIDHADGIDPPGPLAPVDLNQAIHAAVSVSRLIWRPIADVELDLDATLPPVAARPADTHLEVLSLLLRAIQALQETVNQELGDHGTILLRTRGADGYAELTITTTQTGNPFEHAPAEQAAGTLVYRVPIAVSVPEAVADAETGRAAA